MLTGSMAREGLWIMYSTVSVGKGLGWERKNHVWAGLASVAPAEHAAGDRGEGAGSLRALQTQRESSAGGTAGEQGGRGAAGQEVAYTERQPARAAEDAAGQADQHSGGTWTLNQGWKLRHFRLYVIEIHLYL